MDRRRHRAYYYPRPVRREPIRFQSWGDFLTSFAIAAAILGGIGVVVYALTL